MTSTPSNLTAGMFPLAFDAPGRKRPHGYGIDYERWKWKRHHPLQWKWVKDHADTNSFAHSIARAIHEFGVPTPKQQGALNSITEKKQS